MYLLFIFNWNYPNKTQKGIINISMRDMVLINYIWDTMIQAGCPGWLFCIWSGVITISCDQWPHNLEKHKPERFWKRWMALKQNIYSCGLLPYSTAVCETVIWPIHSGALLWGIMKFYINIGIFFFYYPIFINGCSKCLWGWTLEGGLLKISLN